MPLEHLEQVQAAASDFAAAVHTTLASAAGAAGGALTPAAFAPTHSRLLAPVEEAVLQYGDRELAYLGAELQQIAAKGGWAGGRVGGWVGRCLQMPMADCVGFMQHRTSCKGKLV